MWMKKKKLKNKIAATENCVGSQIYLKRKECKRKKTSKEQVIAFERSAQYSITSSLLIAEK